MSLAAILPHVITASIVLVVVGLGSKATWQDMAIALLSIVTVPITVGWLTRAFGRDGEVAPLAVGILLRRWAPGLADKIARPLALLALSTASRHPAIAIASVMAVAVASGAEPTPAMAAILLYVIIAAQVSMPYVAWRRHSMADTATAATARVSN